MDIYLEDESIILNLDDNKNAILPVIDENSVYADITEDDTIALLHALGIRARVNDDAKRQLESIKHSLLF